MFVREKVHFLPFSFACVCAYLLFPLFGGGGGGDVRMNQSSSSPPAAAAAATSAAATAAFLWRSFSSLTLLPYALIM